MLLLWKPLRGTDLTVDALAVAAVGGVDGDDIVRVDEQRDHDLGTGLEFDLLEGGSGSGVTLDGGLGVGDLEGHVGRELAGEAALLRLGHEDHLDVLAFLHQVGVLDEVLREGNLLVVVLVHEVETFLIGIEELVATMLDVDGLDLGTGGEGILEDAAVLQVAELGLDESGTLARLDMLEPYDGARLTVEIQIESVLEISCCCHI